MTNHSCEPRLKLVDERTGASHTVPIQEDTMDANFLSQLNLLSYDNGYTNTAVCRSAISWIDGDKGILRYRGYDIEELAEKSSFLEVAYLLIMGHLPSPKQFELWQSRIMR